VIGIVIGINVLLPRAVSGPHQRYVYVSFHARRRRFAAILFTITFSFLIALSIDDLLSGARLRRRR
jgi:hypothetical protein